MAVGFDPEPRYARYPFLDGAREAVDRAGVDLATVVETEPAVVERARDRVSNAVERGTVGDAHRSTRVELLSYPVARVLVSLVDQQALLDRYAAAEAATALERFWSDRAVADRRTVERRPLTLAELLAALDLDGTVRRNRTADDSGAADSTPWNERADAFEVGVGTYLRLATDCDGREWELATRRLHDGVVPVDGDEFEALLAVAVAERVADGLPLSVPDAVAEPLSSAATAVRESLAELDVDVELDTVVPALFPPCVQALLERARGGEALPERSGFALASFLASIGLDPDTAAELVDAPPDASASLERQLAPLATDGSSQYPPPSCATMVAFGDCVNPDDHCETIAHPLEYYETRLDGEEEVTDWREERDANASERLGNASGE